MNDIALDALVDECPAKRIGAVHEHGHYTHVHFVTPQTYELLPVQCVPRAFANNAHACPTVRQLTYWLVKKAK